jgi:lysophospholipase L1-like esterase
VYNPTTYIAYGDSITANTGCSIPQNCYVGRIAQALSIQTFTNRGVGGYQAADINQWEVFSNDATVQTMPQPLRTLLAGVNDQNYKGAGAYEATFNAVYNAILIWLAVPAQARVAGSTATTTGTCVTDTTFSTVSGVTCTANASTASMSITTTGSSPIYILYRSIDGDAGTFTYKVDAGSPVSATTALTTPIATNAGTTTAVAMIRVTGLSAGTHTVVFTQTHSGTMAITSLATVPTGLGAQQPYVLAGEIPNQQGGGSQAGVNAYVADIDADVAMLAGDGLKIYLAPVSQYLSGSAGANDMYNQLHPNDAGHGELAAAFLSAANLKPGVNSPVAPYVTVTLPYTAVPGDQTLYLTGTGTLGFPNAQLGTRLTVFNSTYTNVQISAGGPCNGLYVPLQSVVTAISIGIGNWACSPAVFYVGSLTLATSAIASGACQAVTSGSVNSVYVPNALSTDIPMGTSSGSIKGFTGFAPVTTGGLTIYPPYVPSGGNYINMDVCNWSSVSITPPSGITFQLKIAR